MKVKVSLIEPQVFTPFLIMQYIFVGRETTFTCSRGKETLSNACFDNKVEENLVNLVSKKMKVKTTKKVARNPLQILRK